MTFSSNLPDTPFTFINKMFVFQQIKRRITTNGQFRKNYQCSLFLSGSPDGPYYFFNIFIKCANGIVKLCKCNFHKWF